MKLKPEPIAATPPRSRRPAAVGGGMWVRGLIACCVVVVGLSLPAGTVAEPIAHSAAAQGGTTFDPSTGVITVNIDFKGALDANGNPITFLNPADGKMETAVQQWQQAVDNIWNAGFANYGFKAPCGKGKPPSNYTFKLNFIITPQKANAPNIPGHHEITLVPVARSGVIISGSAGPRDSPTPKDGDGPYMTDETGFLGQRKPVGTSGSTPTTAGTVAHEVGHLLGLADDYHQKTFRPLPGHTAADLMANSASGSVDQDLVTRVGKQIQKAGYKIPKLCHPTYDIAVTGFEQELRTDTGFGPDDDGNEAIQETWTGSFNNVQVLLAKATGKFKVAIIPLKVLAGTMQGQITFSETRNEYGGPCSGTITTPLYAAGGEFGGGATGALQLQVQLNGIGSAFGALVSAQELADCPARNSLTPPFEQLPFSGPGDAYPCVDDFASAGTTWTVFPPLMTVEFDHPGGGFAPYQQLAHGKSASVDSGRYVNSKPLTCMYGGSGSTTQTNAERYFVTFHRVR